MWARSSSTQPPTPAQRLLSDRLANHLHQFGPGERGAVGLTQLETAEDRTRIVVHLGCDLRQQLLESRREHLFTREGPVELLHVLGVHSRQPGIPLEPLPPKWHDPNRAGDPNQPARRNQGRAGKRVRPTSGGACDAKAFKAKLVGEQKHIVDLVGYTAARPPI